MFYVYIVVIPSIEILSPIISMIVVAVVVVVILIIQEKLG
jgi:hypothetical protein